MRLIWSRRTDCHATHVLAEIGLQDRSEDVRRVWAMRGDYTPTPAQVERGLTDSSELVRLAFTERDDYTLTPAQIARGKKDQSPAVCDATVAAEVRFDATQRYAQRLDRRRSPSGMDR